jgi:heat shock protein HslJ
MKIRRVLVAVAMVAGLILAVSISTNPSSAPLNDTSWILATLNGQPVLSGAQATLIFENSNIRGTDACNLYGTPYLQVGSMFRAVGFLMFTTLMMCPQPVLQQGLAYHKALIEATAYQSDGQELTLFDASGTARATFTTQSQQLAGTSWVVTGYRDGAGLRSPMDSAELTADFGPDGRVSGWAGCNTYAATWEASRKSINVGRAVPGLNVCADPTRVMEQEILFLKALDTVATYRIEANLLELRDALDKLAVTLRKVG